MKDIDLSESKQLNQFEFLLYHGRGHALKRERLGGGGYLVHVHVTFCGAKSEWYPVHTPRVPFSHAPDCHVGERGQ
jgi:hypothetical protein